MIEAADGTKQNPFSRPYKRYVLSVLTLVLTVSYLDTSLITVLLPPMQVDLSLSDAQLGLLTGLAFALFYATLGIPIARWADRGDRTLIASLALTLWGLTVSASLLISNFWQLLLSRVAAGVGQSGCFPPIYSLVGDYFPEPRERTRALAILMLAQPLSSIGYLLGSWLAARYGWRLALFAVGLPGLLSGVLLKLTLREPRRQPGVVVPGGQVSLRVVLMTIWRQRSYRRLLVAMVLLFVVGQGLNPWYAAFLMRNHGMSAAEVGGSLTVIIGVGLCCGSMLGSYVTNRCFSGNERGQMRLSALTLALLFPCSVVFLVGSKWQALTVLLLIQISFGFFIGPTLALLQRLVSSDMRATAIAALMLAANLLGMGVGPQLVGVLSDLARPALGVDSLRYSMLAISALSSFAAWGFWRAGESVQHDLKAVRTHHSEGEP